jgi:hypothetical protein
MPNQSRQQHYGEWIRQVNEEATKELTPFEVQFMESITEQWEDRRWLSDRQAEILERIYARVTD